MALLESCCCWRSVRRGSYASAIYTMVYFSMVTLVTYEKQFVAPEANATSAAGITASLLQLEAAPEAAVAFSVAELVCSACGLLSTGLLLTGLWMDNRLLLIPWMVIVPLTAVVDVTHIIHYTICSETNFKPEIAMLFTINFFLLSLNLYSLLCVVSQYQEYKAGRGRAADEDNLLRAAAVRYLAQPTATSGLSTRRGTHTTVHDGHSPSADREGVHGALLVADGLHAANGSHGANGAHSNGAATNGGLRLAVPPPPYSRRPAGGGGAVVHAGGLSHHSVRKHVQFPDMSTARVVLDEDSSPEDSPGPCAFMEDGDGSTGIEWPVDDKALLSAN